MSEIQATFYEEVNPVILKKIQNLTYEKFYDMVMSLTERDTNAKQKDLRETFRALKDYCKLHNNSESKISCTYKYAEGTTMGRLFCTNSLQSMMAAFRGPLSNGLTHDIDMENCHVSLLVKLCNKYDNIECVELSNYIVKRDEYLCELQAELKINRTTAKKMYLAALNTEDLTTTYHGKRIKSKKFLQFDAETTRIIKHLFEKSKDAYPDRIQHGVWNYKAKYINMLLTNQENIALKKAIKFFHDRNIRISTLIFDGMMVYQDDKYDIKVLLKELNDDFKKYGIQWTVKPHVMDLFEQLCAVEEMEEGVEEKDYYVATDINELAKYILREKISLVSCLGTFYYDGNRTIQSDKKAITAELYKFITNQDYYVAADKGDISYSTNIKNSEDLLKVLFYLCPSNDKYISDLWDYTKGKVFFNNCYFDLKTNQFVQGNYTCTPIKINRDYNGCTEEAKQELITRVLAPIFSIDCTQDEAENEVRLKLYKHFLYIMKQMICGNIEMKRWISLEGLRDSGKGVIVSMLEKAFGGYIRSTNSNNFIAKPAQGDESKALSWLFQCEFARLLISQENKVGSATYDGSLMKKLCSGGDTLECRKLFVDERQMKLQCSLMFCCNDMPRIEPSDTNETKIEINMKTKFIDSSFKDMRYKKYLYLPKDDTVKTELIQQDDIIDAFIHLILSAEDWKEYPAELRKEVLDAREESDEEKILSLFELSGKDCDFLSNDEIQKILTDGKVKKSLKNAKQILVGAGATNDIKTINKRTFRGLAGICRHGESKSYAFTEASDEPAAKKQKPNTMANFVQTKSMELDDE